MQLNLEFYRNPSTPILGTTPSVPWKYPGMALSASSVRLFHTTKALLCARWVLVWNPSAGAAYNAVRLISADDGPSNEVQLAFINANQKNSPIVSAVDVTAALSSLICSLAPGSYKQLLQQTCGDTASKIYASNLELNFAD
jgi:hypothetical protein